MDLNVCFLLATVRGRKFLNRSKSIRVYNLLLFKVFLSRIVTSKKHTFWSIFPSVFNFLSSNSGNGRL